MFFLFQEKLDKANNDLQNQKDALKACNQVGDFENSISQPIYKLPAS